MWGAPGMFLDSRYVTALIQMSDLDMTFVTISLCMLYGAMTDKYFHIWACLHVVFLDSKCHRGSPRFVAYAMIIVSVS